MILKTELEQIIISKISNPAMFLVDVQIGSANKTTKVTITLDGDEGVGIDECAEISRAVGAEVEEKGLFDVAYTLEVSSPGIDKPLKLFRQYVKNIGRTVKVIKKDGVTLTGVLTSAKDDIIVLKSEKKVKSQVETTEYQINIEEIKSTTIVISFN